MNFVTGRYNGDGSEERTVWCGNISEQVTDEILYELFLQAGPLESVRRPKDPSGRPKAFAFIVYKHECSVPYALELFRREKLFNIALKLPSQNMYPSMQGGMSGGKRYSPENRSGRSGYYEGRGSRRDHPYQDKHHGSQYDNRGHSDNNYNQRRHDRGYSSSRSSHERERRDRRSR